jgi:MFS family permease
MQWSLIVLCLGGLLEYFEINMLYVTLPTLYKQFGSPAEVGWAVTVFSLVAASSAAIGGRVGDVIGYRNVLIFAVATSAIGSFVSFNAHELWGLILGRGIQGMSAVILPVAIGAMRTLVKTAGNQKLATGLIAGVAYSAAGIGPYTASIILVHFGWNYIFLASGSLALLVLALSFTLPKMQTGSGRWRDVDFVGGLTIAPGIAMLLAGTTQIKPWGIGSPFVVGMLLGGLAVFGLWYLYERRRPNPVIDVKLFRNRGYAVSCWAFLLWGVGTLSTGAVVPVLAQAPVSAGGFALVATTYGFIAFIVTTFVGAGFNFLGGGLAMRYGCRRATIMGAVFQAAAYGVWMAVLASSVRGISLYVFLTVLSAMGVATLNTALPAFVPESVPTEQTGVAMGVQQVMKYGSQAAGSQIAAVFLSIFPIVAVSAKEAFPSSSGYVLVFGYAAGVTLLIVPVALFAPKVARQYASFRRAAAANVNAASPGVVNQANP